MGGLDRFKKSKSDGFRQFIELIESTPASRRKHLVDVSMQEDPKYTEEALKYIITFQDILSMPDLELAEIIANSKPRTLAFAIRTLGEDVFKRFLRNAPHILAAQIKDEASVGCGLAEVGSAQLKLVSIARDLEKKGVINLKKIPIYAA